MEEVSQKIQKFLEEHNYKSYYTRSWEENGEMWFDVGSWSEFFIWQDAPISMTIKEDGQVVN